MRHTPDNFEARLLPPDRTHAFSLDDSWVWCGSATCDTRGHYHLFAARWPRELPFFNGYKVASEIVRAEAERPEGPWKLAQVVLPDRGPEFWDGRMTHNPTVIRVGNRWYLYYIGATYTDQRPTAEELRSGDADDVASTSYASIRIGCAWADDPTGPWYRPDTPCLDIRADSWDSTVVTNPAPCLGEHGQILLYYRSNTPTGCKIGVASASNPLGPFDRMTDQPILEADGDRAVEDPFVWFDGTTYHMIAKDLTGRLTGQFGNGICARSDDGIEWEFGGPAWSRTITWSDGTAETMGSLERPQLLIEGEPTHMYCAMADGPGGFRQATRSWNQIIPLRTSENA